MSLHLLDTSIWIALAKKEPGPLGRLRALRPSRVAICSVIRAELMFGARKSQRVEANLAGFRGMPEPFVSLPFDDSAADHYGVLRATLESAGTLIGAHDLMIASIARAHDCVLVTRTMCEFERVVIATLHRDSRLAARPSMSSASLPGR